MKRIMQALMLAALVSGAQVAWSEESIEPLSSAAMPAAAFESVFPADAEWTPTLRALQTYADSYPDREMQLGSAFPDDTIGLSE